MDMKFKVQNPVHSEMIQKALFKLGYDWKLDEGEQENTVQHTDEYILTAYEGSKRIYWAAGLDTDFDGHPNTEHVLHYGEIISKDEYDNPGTYPAPFEHIPKPPLGLRPRHFALHDRLVEVVDAIHRHVHGGLSTTLDIPEEWVRELSQLNMELKAERY